MNSELWVEVEEAYSQVADLPPDARTSFLKSVYAERPEVRREVETLLQYQGAAQQLLQSTVVMTAAEMLSEAEDSLLGKVIADKYLIQECLGSGGMGEVYLAEHLALQMPFALKRPRPELRDDPGFRKQFLEEARRAVILKHENVARVHDVIEANDDMFVVMEFIEGDTLAHRMNDLARPFTINEFLPIAIQCASALVAAHEKRIVHLDVKPANIMLTPAGQVKMCDFGVARRLSSQDSKDTTAHSETRWAVAGTPAYMAPEVVLNSRFDERADIFSLGTVFYEMLTGRNPFRADTPIATTARVVSHSQAPISSINPNFDQRLERIVSRMMAKEPDQRYATAVNLVQDLMTLSRARNRFQDMSQSVREAFRESRWLKVMAAVVLIGVLATPPAWMYRNRLLGNPSLPSKKAIMVFGFRAGGGLSQRYADGLAEMLTGRLDALPGINVVSFLEVSESGIKKPSDAFRRLGANLAFTGEILRESDRFRIILNLVDGRNGLQLGHRELSTHLDSFAIQNKVLETAVDLLKLNLTKAQFAELGAAGTQNQSAHSLYLEGKGYLAAWKLEDTEKAIELFQGALVQDANFSLAYAGLGNAFVSKFALQPSRDRSLLDRALKACDDSVRRDPNQAAGHICLGDVQRRRGAYDDAIKEYQRARELDPDDVEVWLGFARTYNSHNELELAEANYKQAIKINPDYYSNYMFLGNFYFASGTQYAEALKIYQQAIDRAPDNPNPYFGFCGAQIFLGNYDEALKACKKSISLRPTFQAYSNLGVAFFDLRQYSSAAQSFERASELNPENYKPVGHLARAYYWMGNRTEANRLYIKAIDLAAQKELAINPKNPGVHAMLARYHAMLGADHRSQAFFHLGVALQERPDNPEFQCIAAVVHNQFGERSAAMGYLERAVALRYSQTEIEAERELDNLRADQTVRTP